MNKKWTALFLACMLLFCSTTVYGAERSYYKLNDPELLPVLEEQVKTLLEKQLGSSGEVKDVQAVYVSKEYLEELEYNSQANIFYGYTLEELQELFQNERYVFGLDENGETTVRKAEKADPSFADTLKEAAIGAGIILVTVVVTVTVGKVVAPLLVEYFVSTKQLVEAAGAAVVIAKAVSELIDLAEEVQPAIQQEPDEIPEKVWEILVQKFQKILVKRVYQILIRKLGLGSADNVVGGIGGIVSDEVLPAAG